ncbi:MAG: hypothetical protein OHK0046_20640 [Anaerolineae bacterium]
MTKRLLIPGFVLIVLLLNITPLFAESSFGGAGSSINCAGSEADLANGSTSVTVGSTTIYTGYHQISGNNQNPIIARYDSGVRVWCRDDYEQTGDDGRGYGLLYDGTNLYAVFSATGTQSGPNYTRWTGSGWLASYGNGGGAKVAIVLRINPADGEPLSGSYLYSKLSNGKTNSFAVTNLTITSSNTLFINGDAWFSPLNTDRSAMTCSGSSPFKYRLEMSLDLSTALGAAADGCVDNSPDPNTGPVLDGLFPANGTAINTLANWGRFAWTHNPVYSWYGVYIAKPGGGFYYQWHEASAVCSGSNCALSLPFDVVTNGSYTWYLAGYSDLGIGPWSTMNFTVNYSLPNLPDNFEINLNSGVTLNWPHDGKAAYYHLYIGTPPYTAPAAYQNWLAASDVCSGSTCTFTLPNALMAGSYEVWAQAWNPAGYNAGGIGTPGWAGPFAFVVN